MDPFSVLGQIILGWLFADFIGGSLHWWEDRVGREDMWLLGDYVIKPNRLHHSDPMAFTRESLWDRNWTTWAAVILIAVPLFWLWGFSVFLLAALAGGLLSNEVHRAAHVPFDMPRWVRLLQVTGFIQSARQHNVHHRPPQDIGYCVLSNWLNPWLDEFGLWQWLERALARVGFAVNGGTR